MQQELDFSKAVSSRNVGMLMAEYGAGPGWMNDAYQKLKEFILYTDKSSFSAEEIRVYCYANGLERPKNERVWGSIISQAQKDGVIEFAGYEKTRNPKAHRAIAAIWRRK